MLARLRDPDMRRTILAQEASPRLLDLLPPLSRQIATRWDRMYLLGDPPDYEPPPESSIAAMAERAGVSPAEFCYDYLVGGDGGRMVYFPVTNYVHGDLEVVRELIEDPHTAARPVGWRRALRGDLRCLAQHHDAGPLGPRPHARAAPAAGVCREGADSETADFFGFNDRGRLQPGMKADVNVIDFDGLRLYAPKMIFDLPAGGRRLVQHVDGYDMTICSGTPIFEKGEETGARPGKLVRSTG